MSAIATAGAGPPSVDDIDHIRAIDRAPLRNLHITQAYHDLASGLAARTGGGANWCSFATWASRQAGSTIRGEDLLANFNRRLGRPSRVLAPLASLNRMLLRKGLFQPQTAFGRIVAEIHSPFDAFERASAEVASAMVSAMAVSAVNKRDAVGSGIGSCLSCRAGVPRTLFASSWNTKLLRHRESGF